ncbi:MAG TPA: DNA polymerase III subunit delta [Smithellaceae bacterium]|nr:DNA polymerase III subunit delta [Smithellaceae bacterium]
MSLDKILADLKKGKIAPCYLLYGGEEYLINEAVTKIIETILPEADRDFGLFNLEGESASLESISEFILTPSLLGGRKIVLVRNTTIFHSRDSLAELVQKIRENISDNKDKAAKYFISFLKLAGLFMEDLQGAAWKNISNEQWQKIVEGDSGEDREKWLPQIVEICISSGLAVSKDTADESDKFSALIKKGLPAGNCLILTASSADKRKKVFKIISDNGIVLHFGEVKKAAKEETLKEAAQQLLERYGKKMKPAAWLVLGKKTGFELRRSMNELEKLISFVGERSVIEDKDIETVVGKTREDSIFELTAALSDKNQAAALAALKSLMDQGMHHLMILTMITREIRFLLQAKILINSGRIPAMRSAAEYGWFQKNIIPALGQLAEAEVKKEGFLTGQHPFVVFNALRNAERFPYSTLLELQSNLLEIDRQLKSSVSDPHLLLENFLIKACSKAL